MPQCDITAAFMRSIETFFPIKAEESSKRWKTTIDDLMKITEWDKISDVTGSWHALKVANITEPTPSEIQMRMHYCLQLGVTELNTLGGRVLKRNPLSMKTPKEFEASLAKLHEDLEFFANVARLKNDGNILAHRNLEKAHTVAGNLQEMFEAVGKADGAGIGHRLACIFRDLNLPKDMALKTARKLLKL